MTLRIVALAIVAVTVAFTASPARAQDDDESTQSEEAAQAQARRILAEARAHEEAERYALAAERYRQMHEIMQRAALERAAIALYWAGRALSRVPGRERDARDTFQSFLDSSTLLTEDAQVRDWRSEALERIAELDARIGPDGEPAGSAAALSSPDGQAADAAGETEPHEGEPVEVQTGSTISPIGPIVMGVGGATLIAGLVTVGVAFGQDQDLLARCPSRVGCDETMRSEVEATRDLGLAGDVLWIAGATIAVAGLVLTLTLTEESNEETALELHGVAGGGVASLRWSVQ